MADLEFLLYASNTTLGWAIVRRIRFERAESLVSAGRMHRVFDEFGQHLGYQLAGETRTDKHLPSLHSSASITAQESMANAGLMGTSATEFLPEQKRITRLHTENGKVLPAEDFIERAQAKVALQVFSSNVNGDKAVRVYPRGNLNALADDRGKAYLSGAGRRVAHRGPQSAHPAAGE